MTKEVEAIDPALVARMVAHCRGVVDRFKNLSSTNNPELAEAREIVAMLPKPVDPDVIEARRIALRFSLPASVGSLSSYRVGLGEFDNHDVMNALTAAIKRGRELAQVSA